MIYINNTPLNTQPSELTENLILIQTEQTSINGSMQRNKIGQKKNASMIFPIVQPGDYQTLVAAFTTGSGVYYYNDQSNYAGGIYSFNGLPFFSESEYVQGDSLYRAFQVNIREI
jgi:hypothetical protein